MRPLNVLAAWLVLLSTVFVLPTQASALAGGIDACFFRDLNGSSTQGDNLNVGANDEGVFSDAVAVELVDLSGSLSTVAATDPATGCVEFPGLADGADYELRVTYPPEYYSSATGGDTDLVPGPPPSVVGDPFTASYAFAFNAGDDLSITGGVSGLPELSLGYFITPGGDPMIETGTAPFDTTGSCPTQVSGDDCGTYDNVVRTNDVTTVGYTITADNIPDGDTNPLDDVVLEQTITPNPGAVVKVPSLHPSCLVAGVAPTSSIAVDPVSGVITVTCNLGSKDNGTSIVPTYIETDGASENGSSFEISTRVYTANDRAQVFDDISLLGAEEIFVSAAPRFDITKGNDASNPFNRVVYYQTTERVNPVTGITEYGVNYQWDLSVLYDGGTKGQAALDEPITFSDMIPAEFVGWEIVACNNTPYGAGNMPNDNRPEEDWGERGTWDCVADRANNEIDITVTDVDTDGDPVPTEGSNGNSLAAGPYFAFAGSVRIWYPLSDFYRTVDPDWTDGDAPILGDYTLDNLVGNFDPDDITGQSNYGDAEEPQENNDRTVNVAIRERGGFSKHLGAYEWADGRIPDGSLTGSASAYPCGDTNAANGSLMAGQTQACSQGDAPVQPGERAAFWYWLRNDGTFPWASETVEICDAFDNSTMALTTWTGGETVYVRHGGVTSDAVIVEYATAAFDDDVVGNDWTNQLAAVRDCTAPNDDWSADPYSFDADPDTSLDQIGMIRVRVDESLYPETMPGDYMQVSFPVEVRDTFNGGPNDGETIPVGTILANNANRTFGSTDYSATFFEAESYTDSPWGERLFLNRHQVRITKTTSIDPESATDDDLFNVQGSDSVVWWVQPAVTAVTTATATNVQVIDTLPAGVSFDAFCQAQQTYPANVVLTSVTPNADGTTTILFDLGDRVTNEPIGPIPVCSRIDNFLEPGTDLTNNVEITSDGDVSPESTRSADRTVSVVASGEFQLTKGVDAPLELQLDTQTFTIGWTNLSQDFDFSPPDVIDVWPYNGDATNPLNQRTEFDSNYSGSYELTDWMAQPTTTEVDGSTSSTGGTWYYSADDPATIPYDADLPANDLSAGSVNWCTQAELTAGAAPCDFTFSDSTAVRFVQSDVLLAESQVLVDYTFQAGTVADPNAPSDRYVNRFAARTDSVDDLIRSNEVLVQVLSMNLGDLVFLDADVDGRFTSGVDVPISGTAVELWIDDGSGTGTFVFHAATTTDANGRYVFEDLLQGTYEVRVPDTELTGGTLDTWTQTVLPLPADNDDNENIDQQGRDSGLGYTTSGPVTLSANTTVDPPLGLEPTGENVRNMGSPYTLDNLSNMSVDLGFRGDPAVQIIKEICDAALGSCDLTTDPLDPSDGWVETAVVPFTDTATWRISVLNTGDEQLTDISVDDDIEDNCDRAAGSIADLGIGESFSWICETTNILADTLNTASVSAFGSGSGTEVTDDDSAAAETPPANNEILVVKYVNGDDAQTAPGVLIDPGAAVTFTYEVTTGAGTVPLGDVTVTDDNGTAVDTGDDFAASYVSGDTDNDDILDLDETWLFEATGFTAVEGQYANWATASGLPLTAGSTEVSDIDPAHYFGVDAGVSLVKFVNGQDADTAPGVLIDSGAPVLFTYEVRNTGNIAVRVNSFNDDAGTPAAGDDWTPTFVSGDTNNDGFLDVDETWLYRHAGESAVEGQYTNVADLVAADPIGNTFPVSDPANYFGSAPAIELQKATNTVDADVDPVLVAEGAPVVWTYVLDNTGNVPVSNPRVLDDAGTPADPADDFYAAFVSGDTNNDGLLDTNERWLFRASSTATEDDYVNNAEATGRGPATIDDSGTTTPGQPVQSDDPSSYLAVDPQIAIIKSTNGVDNATAPGVFVAEGDAVTWSYEVTNPGNVSLSGVSVVDDNGTAADLADDLTAAYVSGDTNNDDLLDVDETWLFEATGVATAGQYANNAVVTGTPPVVTNPDGSITPLDAVTDDDDDFYFGSGPGIAIVKSTNGVDNTVAPGIFVAPGDAVTWSYEVTNPGNVSLSGVSVVDDNGTAADLADDLTAAYVSGDTNNDDLLDVDETWLFEATGVATAGQYANNAVVTGTPPVVTNPDGSTSTPAPVTNDDDDFYFGSEAAIDIIKTVNGEDANVAPGLLIAAGEDVSWEYTVTNTGNAPLIDIVVSDDMGVAVTCPVASLDIGESMVCTGPAEPATLGQYTNIGSVEGTPAVATGDPADPFVAFVDPLTGITVEPVTDDDPANHFGTGPGIEIQKQVCDLDDTASCDVDNDEHWTEVTVVSDGDTAVWRMTVTNIGNVDLADVTVTDPQAPNCDRTRASLAVGEVWAFTCELFDVVEPTTNTAFVEGISTADPTAPPVNDSDIAETVEPAELLVDKNVSSTLVNTGDTVTYTLAITNSGVSDAIDIELLDTLPAGLTSITIPADSGLVFDPISNTITWTIDALPVGATRSVSYTAVVTGVGSIRNDVAIMSDHEENDLTNNQDTATLTSTPSVRPTPLAHTGANTMQMVVVALSLMLLGAGFVVVGRRRNDQPEIR